MFVVVVAQVGWFCTSWVKWLGLVGLVGWGGRIRATRGWISVDRGSKATLPLTMPRRVFKSSAKDSARRPSRISLEGGAARPFRRARCTQDTGPWGPDCSGPYCGTEADGGRIAPPV